MVSTDNLYLSIVENSDDAIVAKDLEGVVRTWNHAAERLFGYTAEEMVGHSIRILLPPDRQREEDDILARIGAGERIGQFFTKRLHKSGKLLDISAIISPIRNADGTIVGASKIARDAGPYLDNQRRLILSERRWRTMADSISQLAWIAGPDGAINWYNLRWYRYTGATPGEMEGWGWKSVHHPDFLDGVVERFKASIASGMEWEDTFPLRRHDGEWRWFLSRAKPIRDETGAVEAWFGTNTDITDERDQAEQIRLLLMEVNHRSKNLLGTVQALARRTAPDDPAFLARFEDRIRSLALNQDILVKREWSHVPIRELVGAQLSFVDDAPGEMSIDGPELPLLPRAAETIGMALHELATNALKYGALSASGGHVDIGWQVDGPQGGATFVMWWRESGGPPVKPSGHVGFGSRLIGEVPRHNLSADVKFLQEPAGVCWEIRCPLEQISRPLGAGG